jgi:DNA-binding transcriptional regulator PaaX
MFQHPDIKKLDFRPSRWGDTASRMYDNIYTKLSKDKIAFAREESYEIFPDIERKTSYTQENTVEIFDSVWMHLANGARNI